MTPRSILVRTIQDVASQYMGEFMAMTAGTAHLKRLGIVNDPITPDQVQAVLRSLKGGLKVLVGDYAAEKVVAEITRRIEGGSK